jgi:hypothetical protein
MRTPISTAVAILVGLMILLGYFVPLEPLLSFRVMLLQWTVILAAFALLVGVVNLFRVHWTKVKTGQPANFYSFVLIVALGLTLAVVGYYGPTSTPSVWIFSYIQVPVEASLMALLTIVLAYAGVRLLHRRLNALAIVFLLTVLVVLLGTAPLLFIGEAPVLNLIRDLIVQIPAVAGARGLLLGIALGAIATGLRILMGADRPYGG